MSLKEAIEKLEIDLDKYEWFVDAAKDQNRIVVYVSEMSADILKLIPDEVNGFQVLVHFKSSLDTKDKYVPVIHINLNNTSN